MNKTYRLIWNESLRVWVAVAEIAKSRSKRASRALMLSTVLCVLAPPALAQSAPPPTALPTGGNVVAGAAVIARSAATLNITQSTPRAAIDWQTFNVGSAATVNFIQPSSSAVVLNRVLSANPSQIFGRINANGGVFLSNPNGVYFAPGASVNVGALVATTHGIANADFMVGNHKFTRNGAGGSVINEGSLTADVGGYIALLAPEVRNQGVIVAQAGTVALAAGEAFSLSFSDARLAGVMVEPSALAALVENGHAVRAPDGLIILSARAADRLQGGVVNNRGTLEASSLVNRGGRVVLTGDHIALANGSRIEATGATGGGEAYVGGGWQGGGGLHQATTVTMAPGASIDVSATKTGAGGTAVLWSDIHDAASQTRAHGTIWAKGGVEGGDGGRIETSGHWLDIAGSQGGASATKGKAGEWLLDPYDVTITGATANGAWSGGDWTPNNNGSTILNTDIDSKLQSGTNVTITTGSAGGQNGDITVAAAIAKASGAADVTLRLNAANSIAVNEAIRHTGGTGKLHVILDADNNNGTRDGAGIILLNNDISTGGGNLQFGTGATLSINGVSTQVGGDVYVAGTGTRTLTTSGGNVAVNGEMIVANTSGLAIDTAGGNVLFGGLLNSGNTYAQTNFTGTWTQALANAASGTGAGTGDTYLATITSRLENAIASRAVNYNESWLGGRRVAGIGSDGAWRWVAGPEASRDGNGLIFFHQDPADAVGGTTVSGLYSNWNEPSEPNNWAHPIGGQPSTNFTQEYESALQFVGAQGKWNDLNKDGYSSWDNLNYYVKETNLAASPVTIDAGAGTVTFSGAVGTRKALAALNVTAGTIAINGGAVTTEGAQTYTGNVTLGAAATTLTQTNASTDFTLPANKSIANATNADASLTIKTTGSIVMDSGSSISSATGKLNAVLWADSDASSDGMIYLQNASSIGTNGGHLWLGGGAQSGSAWNGLTVGNANAVGTGVVSSDGITLYGANINTSGGNIAMYGEGRNGAQIFTCDGIKLRGTSTIDSGAGTIYMYGKGTSNNPASVANGIELGSPDDQTHTITSANSTADAIKLEGISTSASSLYAWGIYTWGTTIAATGGGGVTLTGSGAKHAGVTIASNGAVLANSGKITLLGTGYGADLAYAVQIEGTVGQKSGSTVTASSSDIDIIGNTLSVTGTVQSSGNLTVKPYNVGTAIGIAGGAGTLQLAASDFGTRFADGFSSITVGSADAGAIAVGGATTFRDSTTLRSNSTIAIDGAVTADENLALNGNGAIGQSAALQVAGTTAIAAGAGNDITLIHADNDFAGAVSVASGNNLAIADKNAMTLGAINAAGTVDVATLTGNLILTGAIDTSNATANALKLYASKNTAAGTATGGNILVSGGSVSVGAGGTAKLYSGSVADSTGLTALAGAGSGRFRYNADATTDFSGGGWTALSAGVNAIYREQLTVTVTASNAAKTYDGNTYSGGNGATYSGFVNGDTSASLGGTLTYGGGSQGATNAGSHVITPSGHTSGLGYALAYADGSLTVNPAALTITADNASKTYGASKTFTGTEFATSGLVNGETVGSVTLASTGSAATATVVGGPYAILASNAAGGTFDAGNYALTYVNGSLVVNPAALDVTADARSKTYGAVDPALTYTYSGLVGGDTADVFSGGLSRTTGEAVAGGPYAIGLGAVSAGTNYSINYTGANLTITPAALTITADNASKTYGASKTFTGTEFATSGLVNGETVGSVTLASTGSAATATVAGGPYAILASNAAGGTFDAGNYALTYVNGSLTVLRRQVTVTADPKSKDEGAGDPALTYQAETPSGNRGLVSGESLTGSLTRDTGGSAGIYPIRQGTVSNDGNANYDIQYVGANLTIIYVPPPPPPPVLPAPTAPPPPLMPATTPVASPVPSMPTGPAGAPSGGPVSLPMTPGGGSPTPAPVPSPGDGAPPSTGTSTAGTQPGGTQSGDRPGITGGAGSGNAGTPPADTPTNSGTPGGNSAGAASNSGGTQIARQSGGTENAGGTGTGNAGEAGTTGGAGNIQTASGATSGTQPGGSGSSGGSGNASDSQDATGNPNSAGISVSLVKEPSVQQAGVIAVSVPKEMATAGSGFSFPLPAQVTETAGSNTPVRVTTIAGDPLPGWLKFDPETKVFAASAVPDGAFPMQVVVTVAGTRTVVVISERNE